jgi:hypothetical protein
MTELIVDKFVEDGMLKDIPVIGTLVDILKLTGSIRDRLFTKKLLCFLSELSNTTSEQRADVLRKLETEKGCRSKIGEKLLYIIDRCEDHTKAQVIARLFAAFINQALTYSEFFRAASVIDDIYIDDLNTFISGTEVRTSIENVGTLLNSGLYYLENLEIRVRDQDDLKMTHDQYIIEGSELTVYISEIGKKIRKILGQT